MVIFNALLNLRELKELYSGKPVCVCPLYKGSIGTTKRFETSGNPVVIPKYVALEKLNVEFLPKQAGTGDPSPENVRPISGYDSVTVTQSKGEAQVKQITLTFPETIYGGTVDAVTGVGSKEWRLFELNGETVINTVNELANTVRISIPIISLPATGLIGYCNIFPWELNYALDSEHVYCNQTLCYVFVAKTKLSSIDVAGASAYLAAQAASGTPVQVAYKLATPEPFEISKISIPSLIGENTFFTNGNNMDIIYKKALFWGDEA